MGHHRNKGERRRMSDEQYISIFIIWFGSIILLTYYAIDIKQTLHRIELRR